MRVFALGLLLMGCSVASGGEQGVAQSSAAGEASSSWAGGDPSGGAAAGGVLGLARAGASTGGGGQGGEPITAVAGTGGVSNAAGAGGSANGGTIASGGGTAEGGSGGSSDPLAPFPAPGCEDWTAYRVPPGKFLAVTGDFDINGLKDGQCMALSGALYQQSCATASNMGQCQCSITSPPSCGQYCSDGDTVIVLKAEPGKMFTTQLREGVGSCVNGIPVAK